MVGSTPEARELLAEAQTNYFGLDEEELTYQVERTKKGFPVGQQRAANLRLPRRGALPTEFRAGSMRPVSDDMTPTKAIQEFKRIRNLFEGDDLEGGISSEQVKQMLENSFGPYITNVINAMQNAEEQGRTLSDREVGTLLAGSANQSASRVSVSAPPDDPDTDLTTTELDPRAASSVPLENTVANKLRNLPEYAQPSDEPWKPTIPSKLTSGSSVSDVIQNPELDVPRVTVNPERAAQPFPSTETDLTPAEIAADKAAKGAAFWAGRRQDAS